MFCYCGGCRDALPRESHICLCVNCHEGKERWMDVNLSFTRCDGCGRLAFCHAEEKKGGQECRL